MSVSKKVIKSWEEKDVDYLQELLEANSKQIMSLVEQQEEYKELNKALQNTIQEKRRLKNMEYVEVHQEQLLAVLDLMEHTEYCQKHHSCIHYEKIEGYAGDVCYCPKCALEYLINNPWCGYDFKLSIKVDINEDGNYV